MPVNLTEKQEEKLLTEIRRRYDAAKHAWQDIQDAGKEDMRYVAGDPWDPKDREARIAAGRPCLALDELGQYFNQVINDVRANPRAIKFSPTGDGANDKTALFYADKTREIEYRSHAQIAYTTAFENAVQRSYGWVRLKTKYRPKSFNQEIWIEAIPNPDNVLPDPSAIKPDSSDMTHLFYSESWRIEEFTRQYPKAKVTNFGDFVGQAGYERWVKADKLILAEYWTVETKESELLQIRDPLTGQLKEVMADDVKGMPVGGIVIHRRPEAINTVVSYLTNGVEILSMDTWAGQHIPFVSCFGKVIYVDEGSGAERKLLSMTRLARDPYMLYCYYRTCEAELVGMTPKTPFIGYVGQFRTRGAQWQKVNHEPQAYLEADPVTEATGQQILPLPTRQPYDPPIQPLEVGAESARRAIQAAMGSNPLPTQAQRKNEKSGVALQKIEQTAQRGTYHFLDHYDDMIRQVGVQIEDLMGKIIDTPRDEGIRKDDETAKTVRVNDPQHPESISTQGSHLVTISTGPAFESQREQGQDFAASMVSGPALQQIAGISGPQAAAKLFAKSVKLMNLGPIGDQIADTISPPESQDGKPSPEQLQQENGKLKQMLEQATQQMNEQQQIIDAKQVEGQTKIQQTDVQQQNENQRTLAEIASRERIELEKLAIEKRKLEIELELGLAKLGSAQSMARGELEQQDLHHHDDQMLQREQMGAQQAQADMDRQAAERQQQQAQDDGT